MTLLTKSTREYRRDGRQVSVGRTEQGSDADQDVEGEAFNMHSWYVGKKTVSIYTELDDLNDPVAERR